MKKEPYTMYRVQTCNIEIKVAFNNETKGLLPSIATVKEVKFTNALSLLPFKKK